MAKRKPLSYYLRLQYPFRVRVPAEGGYYADFPDLPGIMTDADRIEDLPAMIEEARRFWIEGEYEDGRDIPLPTLWNYEEEYSGRFNLRLPPSLHEALVDSALQADVSLNQYVVSLLSRGDSQARVEARLERLEAALGVERGTKGARVAEGRTEYKAQASGKRKTSTRRKQAAGKRSRAK